MHPASPSIFAATVLDIVTAAFSAAIGVAGTLLAAGVSLGGLYWVFRHERNERADERFDAAVADLMRAVGGRATELQVWLSEQTGRTQKLNSEWTFAERDEVWGGPMSTTVNTAADIAVMHARSPARLAAMNAVARTTYIMGFARTVWVIAKSGELVADLRRWRTGELTQGAFLEKMNTLYGQAADSAENSPKPIADEPGPLQGSF